MVLFAIVSKSVFLQYYYFENKIQVKQSIVYDYNYISSGSNITIQTFLFMLQRQIQWGQLRASRHRTSWDITQAIMPVWARACNKEGAIKIRNHTVFPPQWVPGYCDVVKELTNTKTAWSYLQGNKQLQGAAVNPEAERGWTWREESELLQLKAWKEGAGLDEIRGGPCGPGTWISKEKTQAALWCLWAGI